MLALPLDTLRRMVPKLSAARELRRACQSGTFELARELAGAFELTADDLAECDDYGALRAACKYGHIDIARWLAERFALRPKAARARDNYALYAACEYGRTKLVHWLVAHFGLTATDVRTRASRAFRAACTNNHLELAQWLVGHFGLTAADINEVDSDALSHACAVGHGPMLVWLLQYASAATETGARNVLFSACGGCARMQLQIVERIAGVFGFGPEAPADLKRECLGYACKMGNLELARWLVAHFHLTATHARGNTLLGSDGLGNVFLCDTLTLTCISGHLAVAKWLVATFSLTANDVQAYHALCCACRARGTVELAQWLVATFGLVITETTAVELAANACLEDNLAVAQWATTFGRFPPETAEVHAIAAANDGQHAMVAWLVQEYALPPIKVRNNAVRRAGRRSRFVPYGGEPDRSDEEPDDSDSDGSDEAPDVSDSD